MQVLIVTMDGGGNLPPMLGIARALVARGDRVRVLGHAVQRQAVESAGLPFTPITRGRDYDASLPRGTVDGVLSLSAMFADRRIGADALAMLAEEPADVVVVDCLLWGALDEIARTGVPTVSVVHSISAFFEGNARGPLGLLSRFRGVNPVAAARRAALTLVTTRADFEPVGGGAPGAEHSGFVWQDEPFEATAAERPSVLVSFSTTVFPGQRAALQRVIDGLADEDVDVIVTSGAVDPAALRPAGNTRIERRLDHGEVLRTASLVIGHGGHSTTSRALTAGIPVLVLPMHPLMDQPAVGRAVARLGVGATLPKSASPHRIRAAANELLTSAAIRTAAARVGSEARQRDGAVEAVRHLDALVSRS